MFLFELVILPWLLRTFGIRTPQRVGSIIIVPCIALLPSLSSLHGKGHLLVLATIGVMFTIYWCLDLVSVWHHVVLGVLDEQISAWFFNKSTPVPEAKTEVDGRDLFVGGFSSPRTLPNDVIVAVRFFSLGVFLVDAFFSNRQD